jgi:hypothetical protein
VAKHFDEQRWSEELKQPGWHTKLYPELKELRAKADQDGAEGQAIKDEVRLFFEHKLQSGDISLADSGPDLDKERGGIDSIVIHHTSSQPGYTLARMNAVHLLNIYVPYYAESITEGEEGLKARPIWSNHVQGGRQVFYAYHWLVRMDGTAERLLGDGQIGWQAGDWETNCRSVGICLDNDYEGLAPSAQVLDLLTDLIQVNYPGVKTAKIIGHREVNPKTVCPGDMFLDGWKSELLRRLGEAMEG